MDVHPDKNVTEGAEGNWEGGKTSNSNEGRTMPNASRRTSLSHSSRGVHKRRAPGHHHHHHHRHHHGSTLLRSEVGAMQRSFSVGRLQDVVENDHDEDDDDDDDDASTRATVSVGLELESPTKTDGTPPRDCTPNASNRRTGSARRFHHRGQETPLLASAPQTSEYTQHWTATQYGTLIGRGEQSEETRRDILPFRYSRRGSKSGSSTSATSSSTSSSSLSSARISASGRKQHHARRLTRSVSASNLVDVSSWPHRQHLEEIDGSSSKAGGINTEASSSKGSHASELRRSLSNFSLLLGNDEEEDDVTAAFRDSGVMMEGSETLEGIKQPFLQHIPRYHGHATQWTRMWLRRLLWITLVWVGVTMLSRVALQDEEPGREMSSTGATNDVKTDDSQNLEPHPSVSSQTSVLGTSREIVDDISSSDDAAGALTASLSGGFAGRTMEETGSCAALDAQIMKNESCVEDVAHGAVAADDQRCSSVGVSIMHHKGGNAVDAAIAATFCLGVVNPASSGLGGGAFLMVHVDRRHHEARMADPNIVMPPHQDVRRGRRVYSSSAATKHGEKVTEVIDCLETAPAGSTSDMLDVGEERGLSVAVPGQLRGLELLHARHGSLPWSELVEPSLRLARDGFVVSEKLAKILNLVKDEIPTFANFGRAFTHNNDGVTPLKAGDVVKRSDLATTLEAVMTNGSDAIYTGDVAVSIAKDVQHVGGILTADDLANYRPVLRHPLVAKDVGGFKLVGVPPPSSGFASIAGAARFLTGYRQAFSTFASTLSAHRMVEALKHVFAIRMSMGDPNVSSSSSIPSEEAMNDLVHNSYMDELRRQTRDDGVLPLSRYGGTKWAKVENDEAATLNLSVINAHHENDHGTTHLSVIDKDRNAVSITTSLNTYFGSKVLNSASGILLNDQMEAFGSPGKKNRYGLKPSEHNSIAPGKRPLSSMAPTLVFFNNNEDQEEQEKEEYKDGNLGQVVMALGGSGGGPKVVSSVLQVILNYMMLNMPLYEAVVHPRLFNQFLYHNEPATLLEDWKLKQEVASRSREIVTDITVSSKTRSALLSRGHELLLPSTYEGATQAIAVDLETNLLTAVSDIRRGGRPAGY